MKGTVESRRGNRNRIVQCSVVLLVLIGGISFGAEGRQTDRSEKVKGHADGGQASTTKGLVVIRDRESGQLRAPTAAERSSLGLDGLFRARKSSSRIEVRPDGSLRLLTGSKTMNFSIATRMRSGIQSRCVQGKPEDVMSSKLTGTPEKEATLEK